jgi:hypothetical protein
VRAVLLSSARNVIGAIANGAKRAVPSRAALQKRGMIILMSVTRAIVVPSIRCSRQNEVFVKAAKLLLIWYAYTKPTNADAGRLSLPMRW